MHLKKQEGNESRCRGRKTRRIEMSNSKGKRSKSDGETRDEGEVFQEV